MKSIEDIKENIIKFFAAIGTIIILSAPAILRHCSKLFDDVGTIAIKSLKHSDNVGTIATKSLKHFDYETVGKTSDKTTRGVRVAMEQKIQLRILDQLSMPGPRSTVLAFDCARLGDDAARCG